MKNKTKEEIRDWIKSILIASVLVTLAFSAGALFGWLFAGIYHG